MVLYPPTIMRIFIPSYNRAETITTTKIFTNHEVQVVVHNEEQAKPYIENGIEPLISNTPPGLVNQRQWVLEQAEEGEWVIMLDDNIRKFMCVKEEFYGQDLLSPEEAKHAHQVVAEEDRVMSIFEEIIEKTDSLNLYLAGIRPFSSPFYGRKKWKVNGFCRGKCLIIKRDKNMNFGKMKCIEDMEFNCMNMLEKGGMMRMDYLYPDAPAYGGQKGGLGLLSDREEQLYKECKELMERYPELLRYKGWKKSTKMGTDVQFRLYKAEKINKWRQAMVATGKANPSLFENYPY